MSAPFRLRRRALLRASAAAAAMPLLLPLATAARPRQGSQAALAAAMIFAMDV